MQALNTVQSGRPFNLCLYGARTFGEGHNFISPASGNSPCYIPFMFHVNASLSFCPSISISSLIGTRTSGWDAFSWITAGSWSSKLKWRPTTQYMQRAHDTSGIHRGKATFVGSNPHTPTPRSVHRQTPQCKLTGLWQLIPVYHLLLHLS